MVCVIPFGLLDWADPGRMVVVWDKDYLLNAILRGQEPSIVIHEERGSDLNLLMFLHVEHENAFVQKELVTYHAGRFDGAIFRQDETIDVEEAELALPQGLRDRLRGLSTAFATSVSYSWVNPTVLRIAISDYRGSVKRPGRLISRIAELLS